MSTDKRSRATRAIDKARAAANLTPFKPGQSGNPGGRPKQHREAVVEIREAMPHVTAAMIGIVLKAQNGGQLTRSDEILSKHCEFLVQFAYGRHAISMPLLPGQDVGESPLDHQNADGAGLSALLRRARIENEARDTGRANHRHHDQSHHTIDAEPWEPTPPDAPPDGRTN